MAARAVKLECETVLEAVGRRSRRVRLDELSGAVDAIAAAADAGGRMGAVQHQLMLAGVVEMMRTDGSRGKVCEAQMPTPVLRC